MLHLVAHTVPDRLLFHSLPEGGALLERLATLPVEAACLMPDHVHLLVPVDVRRPLAAVLSGWSRSCNARRGEEGPLVRRVPEPEVLTDRQKIRRSVRYIHLNPCRAGLADDPLAWPLSTHRDACGLTIQQIGPARGAKRFHRYVSGDPSVAVQGSELPCGVFGVVSLEDVLVAVSAVTRTPPGRLKKRPTRALAVRAGLELAAASTSAIAAALGCSRTSLYRMQEAPREHVAVVARVLRDPRFGPMHAADLRGALAWQRYLCWR